MLDRVFEPICAQDVVAAQTAWIKHVTEQDVDALLDLYDVDDPSAPLQFKPTLSDVIRTDRAGARAYFVGGDPDYPHDHGFLHHGWKTVDFRSAIGPMQEPGGLTARDMGQCFFENGDGDVTQADYTFIYHKVGGRALIALHHSSLTWCPAEAD